MTTDQHAKKTGPEAAAATAFASEPEHCTPSHKESVMTSMENRKPSVNLAPGLHGAAAIAAQQFTPADDRRASAYSRAVSDRVRQAVDGSGRTHAEIAAQVRMPIDRLIACYTGQRPWALPELIRTAQVIGAGPVGLLLGDVFESELELWLTDSAVCCHVADCRNIVDHAPQTGPAYCDEHQGER